MKQQWVIDDSWPGGSVWDLKDEHGKCFGFVQRVSGANYVFGNSRVLGQRMFATMADAAKWVAAALPRKDDV